MRPSALRQQTRAQPFSIYIHWPYCERYQYLKEKRYVLSHSYMCIHSKCTYCNFNKYINPKNPPYERLANAMATELTYFLTHPKYQLEKRKLHSIYFGGGTPKQSADRIGLVPSVIRRLLDTISQYTNIHDRIEISMEANPTSIEMTQLKAFRDIGINRLSLGVQSFNSADLKLLGRDHSGDEAVKAISIAKDIFHQHRVTFDMIYARPGQTVEALTLSGDHLSMYQLSLEKSTPLHKKVVKGLVKNIPDSDIAADMYEDTVSIAKQYGFTHYEVSSFARHQKSISRHNFSYWQGMDFLGKLLWPGAHGRLTENLVRERTFGEFHPEKYMALCEAEGEGIRKSQPVSSRDMAEELIVFGLRTRMGIPRSRFKIMTNGQLLDDFIDKQALAMLIEAGFVVDESSKTDTQMSSYVPEELEYEWLEGGIRPTEAGLERIDSILPLLMKREN
ncbi:Radical S-adenosyl methionine domain-containing protein 1, mitochondrial, partial [Choanephora cucurbitarum]